MTAPTVVEKVRKLLALSSSSNEHEAALAAEKAQELLLRHGLDMAYVVEDGAGRVDVEQKAFLEKAEPWQRELAGAISTTMGGMAIFGRGYGLTFIGPKGAVDGIVEMYRRLETQLAVFADIETATRDDRSINARTFKRGFLLGAVETVALRLEKREREITKDPRNAKALTVLRSSVDEFIEDRYGKVGRDTDNGAEPNWNAYAAGGKAGANVDLGDARVGSRRALPAAASY